ncbi:hypothetical protein P7C73_g3978, partial [Tremellales sp. Uapishka_1]
MTLSYLVSTAGHARQQNDAYPHEIQSILQLIEGGAQELGNEKVVGFMSIGENGEWRCDRYCHGRSLGVERCTQDVRRDHLAAVPDRPRFPRRLDSAHDSSPQCSPSAIVHLYESTSSTYLVYHPKYTELAKSAKVESSRTIPLPAVSTSVTTQAQNISQRSPSSISHIFHTSGTSGNPKPIPQTHIGSTFILPRRTVPSYLSSPNGDHGPPAEPAAFTTTPLFHGGVSDLLRAWMARSMIYFYPTSDLPITTNYVVSAIEACQRAPAKLELSPGADQGDERAQRFRVNAFLSVPYILTILAEDEAGKGVEMLKSMDLVSTGGAPLDTRVGDRMVERGVKLVSRLGSSECGFLLSSYRDFDLEDDWEWLRNDSAYSDALVFEPVAGGVGKYEMVVTDGWSSKTNSNREDGSYATGDLYEPHPTKPNVWKYVGRGDDIVVLKASPGPIETIVRASPHFSDALVVGSDRSQLGLLLFPRDSLPADVQQLINPLLAEANALSPSYAQISADMCLIVPSGKDLPKSSKGTVQRGLAYERFALEIERLYASTDGEGAGENPVRNLGEIEEVIAGLVRRVAGKPVERETDLFSWGVNSLMAIRIRAGMQKTLETRGKVLSQNVVFEHPSVARLSQLVFDLQEGRTVDAENIHRLMEKLVQRYSVFPEVLPPSSLGAKPDGPKTILLTGGTGSLGASLIEHLLSLPVTAVDKIICLVRASDDEGGRSRMESALKERDIEANWERLQVFSADLGTDRLGLEQATYKRLVCGVDIILHVSLDEQRAPGRITHKSQLAWPVHFASSLTSFEENIRGTKHLLDFTLSSPHASFYYSSSLASVLNQPSLITETCSTDCRTATATGYSQSKWVTERICALASERKALQERVHILRVGQLCGDTRTGRWNEKEGWPLLIRTSKVVGCLPVLTERPSWLPVDIAARAIIDVTLGSPQHLIYHIAHPHLLEWTDILDSLEDAGLVFERVSPQEWLKRVERSSDDLGRNPSKGMLWLWKQAYGSEDQPVSEVVVETTHAVNESVTLREAEPVGKVGMAKMVEAWKKSDFL